MEKHTGNYGEERVEVFPARDGKSAATDKTEKTDKSDKSDRKAPLTADYRTPLTDTHAGQSKKDGAAKDCKGEKSCR
jgi:hypothetical protein